ncbi:MAG: aminotransferase class V-fold PLP-dependent enzyme [Thermoanaerobaculia bacterium]
MEPRIGTPTQPAELGDQRDRFEVSYQIAYFNTASICPLLRSVREAGERALARRAAPWEISAADWFTDVERLRERFAALLGASADGVALVPATSYGLGLVARNVQAAPGDRVVVLAGEFPSNFYTWQRFARETGAELALVQREEGQSWTEATLEHIDERTRVVAVPNVHWTNGALLDLVAVSDAAKRAGAVLVVDATQSLGALPLDLARVRPDFLVAAGYKWLLGSLGVSYLYVAEEHRDGRPLEENWINRAGSDDFAAVADYSGEYLPGARRFDFGQHSSFTLVPMALAALDQLLEWGVANVSRALAEVTGEIAGRAAALGLRVPASGERGPHMLGVELPREVARRIGAHLSERGVVTGVRGSALRISPHLHITREEVDRLLDALATAL